MSMLVLISPVESSANHRWISDMDMRVRQMYGKMVISDSNDLMPV